MDTEICPPSSIPTLPPPSSSLPYHHPDVAGSWPTHGLESLPSRHADWLKQQVVTASVEPLTSVTLVRPWAVRVYVSPSGMAVLAWMNEWVSVCQGEDTHVTDLKQYVWKQRQLRSSWELDDWHFTRNNRHPEQPNSEIIYCKSTHTHAHACL